MWNFAVDEIHDMMWNQKCNRLRHEGYGPDLLQISNLINISPGVLPSTIARCSKPHNISLFPWY